MIRLLLEPVNLLILDEPTNHLDMKTKDILKQAIKDFDGTVILVSHDREFLDGLVEKVYEFGGGKIRECLGGIYEFLEKKKLANLTELERNKPAAANSKIEPKQAPVSKTEPAPASASQRKLSYADQKERERIVKRARKKVEDAETAITELEQEIAELEQRFAAGEAATELYTRHADLNKQLENAMSVWELASEELAALES